ncbi:MAG: hypothetical protein FWG90_05275 [Oscillospiraceae bacterium]|nr:hypothetical protein [Oscillospiraceae bacterium]
MNMSFLKQFDKFSVVYENPARENVSADRVYELVSSKIALSEGVNEEFNDGFSFTKSRIRLVKRPAVLAAAVCAAVMAMGITVAAYYLSASDAFRGILNEQSPDGGIAPLSSMSPIVDATGSAVNQTVSSGGIDVTLRGVVGDGQSLKILLDVYDPSGRSLEDFRFGNIKMRTDDTLGELRYADDDTPPPYDIWLLSPKAQPGDGWGTSQSTGMNYEVIAEENGKAAFVIDVRVSNTEKESLIGKNLYLDLDYMYFDEAYWLDYKNSPDIISDGHWSFTAPLNFESLTRMININKNISLGGLDVFVKDIEVSPYNVTFSADLDSPAEIEAIPLNLADTKAVLIMKDGSVNGMKLKSSTTSPESLTVTFNIDVVIDPEQVETITIDN